MDERRLLWSGGELRPERSGNVLGTGLRGEAGGGEDGEPGGDAGFVGKILAEEGADLFAALLEAGADEGFGLGRKNEGCGFADEVEEVRLDVGLGVEAAGGDFVAGGEIVGRLEEDGDGAELFGAVAVAVSL